MLSRGRLSAETVPSRADGVAVCAHEVVVLGRFGGLGLECRRSSSLPARRPEAPIASASAHARAILARPNARISCSKTLAAVVGIRAASLAAPETRATMALVAATTSMAPAPEVDDFATLCEVETAVVAKMQGDERGGFDLMPELGYKPSNKYLPPRAARDQEDGRRLEDAKPDGGFLGWLDDLLSR